MANSFAKWCEFHRGSSVGDVPYGYISKLYTSSQICEEVFCFEDRARSLAA
ncbi:hypothetical protein DP42_4716 [Burkholderia pseudomallei]|nr:hypothetical protein DO73_4198 [Burkholderia pseudomallei]KGD22382.1 hypothetical protein DP42_4716 [Burkholderia pseudomallei]